MQKQISANQTHQDTTCHDTICSSILCAMLTCMSKKDVLSLWLLIA